MPAHPRTKYHEVFNVNCDIDWDKGSLSHPYACSLYIKFEKKKKNWISIINDSIFLLQNT